MFDVKALGAISQQDLIDGLRMHLDFGEFTPDDIHMFFTRFDPNETGRISFNQFGDAILPFSQEFANLVTERPDFYIRRQCELRRFFTCDTRSDFQLLWRQIF